MRRLAVLLATCLLAAGCGSAGSGSAGEDPAGSPAADPSAAALDQRFLDALAEEGVLAEGADRAAREQAIREGRRWCTKLTDPETTRTDVARSLAELLRESDARTAQKATAFFGTAARTYCPEAAERLAAG